MSSIDSKDSKSLDNEEASDEEELTPEESQLKWDALEILKQSIDQKADLLSPSCTRCHKSSHWRTMYSLQIDPTTLKFQSSLSLNNQLSNSFITTLPAAAMLFRKTACCVNCLQRYFKENQSAGMQ